MNTGAATRATRYMFVKTVHIKEVMMKGYSWRTPYAVVSGTHEYSGVTSQARWQHGSY